MKSMRIACAAAVFLGTGACGNRTRQVSPEDCTTFDAGAALRTDEIARLAGDFTLVMTATGGEQSGNTASGVITFRANIDDMSKMAETAETFRSNVVVPYYGMSDIDVSAVGALPLGHAASDDPVQPGALMVQANTPAGDARSLVVRLGTDGNMRNVMRFDGGYTVLRVRYVSADTLLGEWASGTMTETASGYFCAIRR